MPAHRIPSPLWHAIRTLLSQDDPPLSYEEISRRGGTGWRVVAAVDRNERVVGTPVLDLAGGLDLAELPDAAPPRRCPGCGAALRTLTCPACRDNDLLAGRAIRRVFGDDAPHAPILGLELHEDDMARYREVVAVRRRFPGTSTEAASQRSAALAQLAEAAGEQQERSEASKKRVRAKTSGGRTKPKRKPTRRDKAA